MMWWTLLLFGCPVITESDLEGVRDADGDGYVALRFGGDDCDDQDALVHPDVPEVYYDGVDANCDGLDDFDQDQDGVRAADNDDETPEDCDDSDDTVLEADVLLFLDGDGDGFGGGYASAQCAGAEGYVEVGGDCNDSQPDVHPGADEVWYNGVDEDCDGVDDDQDGDGLGDADDCDDLDPDVGGRSTFFLDGDGDGFAADGALSVEDCAAPVGYAAAQGDCDDANPGRSPGLQEVCDADDVDEDCDGMADDADPSVVGPFLDAYPDLDGDGFGADGVVATPRCDVGDGWADVTGDCVDDPAVTEPFPAGVLHPETEWFVDADGDGFGDPERSSGRISCFEQPFLAPTADDCNDGDPNTHPGADDPVALIVPGDPAATVIADEDCAGDSDYLRTPPDAEGIVWPEPLSLTDPTIGVCAGTNNVWVVAADGTGDFVSLQAAIDAASPCDRLQVHEGVYDPIVVTVPLVIAAYPDEEVIIRGVPADSIGILIVNDDIVLSGLTLEDYETGVLILGHALLEHLHIEGGRTALRIENAVYPGITYVPDLHLFQTTVESVDTIIESFSEGTIRVAECDFEENEGIFGFITYLDVTTNLHIYGSTFDNNGFLTAAIYGTYDDLYLRDVLFVDNSGRSIEVFEVFRAQMERVDVVRSYSTDFFFRIWAPLDFSPSTALLDRVRVLDSNLGAFEDPFFGTVGLYAFESAEVRRIEMVGNQMLGGNVATPWLSVVPFDGFGNTIPGAAQVRNAVIAANEGVGIALAEGEIHNATLLGMQAGVGSISNTTGPARATRVFDSILWDNARLASPFAPSSYLPTGFGLAGAGQVAIADSLVSFDDGTATVDNVESDHPPGFLRYHPSLPARLWNLQLQPTSPELSVAPVDLTDWPCTSSTDGDGGDRRAVDDQRGGYGNRGADLSDGYTGADPEPYNSCWPEALGIDDVMYDSWRNLHVAHLPDADEDDDGLNNLAEFALGTLPEFDDTDGDEALDGADTLPLDPFAQ